MDVVVCRLLLCPDVERRDSRGKSATIYCQLTLIQRSTNTVSAAEKMEVVEALRRGQVQGNNSQL